jgi:RNA polymerase sigma-70 factor (ECF subfamily)
MSTPPAARDPALDLLPPTLRGGLEIVALRALGDPDDARDAVQETLVRALAAIRQQRVPATVPLPAFVYGIARHVIADTHRRRHRQRDDGDPVERAVEEPSPLEALVRDEERELLGRALARLPRADRQLLQHCFVQGDRVAQIAARTGEPAARVRKRKSRALARLRELLAGEPGAGHTGVPNPTVKP